MKWLVTGLLCAMLTLSSVTSYATVRYVATTGNDANTCAASATITTPKQTIASAASCMAAGDTLYLRSGTYQEPIHVTALGTAGNWITIGGYPGDTALTAIIQITNSQFYPNGATPKQYHIYQNLVFDGTLRTAEDTDGTVLFGNNGSTPDTSHDVIIQDNEIRNIHGVGIFGRAQGNITIRRNKIHDMFPSSTFRFYCMYIAEGNGFEIYQNECYNAAGGGIQIFPKPINVNFYENYIHDSTTDAGFPIGCMVVEGQAGNILTGISIHHNILANCGTPTSGNANGIEIHQYTNGVIFRNNTCYNNKNFCVVTKSGGAGVATTNAIIENNIALSQGGTISDSGIGTILNNNKTTGAITDCTISTSDFRLKVSSPCANAGITRVGFSYNGTNPAQGAFEEIVFASCSVESATPTKLSVIFTNNVFPPLLPSSSVTGFTARKAGVNDAITASVRTGDNQIDLTLTTAIVAGNAVDISYTGSGNLTDSALTGVTLNQPYNTVLTNQSCTNNTAGAPVFTFTQTGAFIFFGLRGSEVAPVKTPYSTAPESSNVQVMTGGAVRLRLVVKCGGADCPATGFYPFYSCASCTSAGTYTKVPDVFVSNEDIGFCGSSPDPDIPLSGTATTNQTSTTGTFVPGAIVRTSNAIPTITLTNGFKTELEYCLSFSAAATAARTYSIQLRKQDTSVLDTYTATPVITLIAPASGMGF